jgi:hypothetical protein
MLFFGKWLHKDETEPIQAWLKLPLGVLAEPGFLRRVPLLGDFSVLDLSYYFKDLIVKESIILLVHH